MKGRIPWNKSKIYPILQFSLTGEFIREWSSKFEAEKELHLSHLEKVLRGERQSAGGYKWQIKP